VVILSTHIVEDVSELCSRMAIIDKGAILLEAEPLRAVAALQGRIWRRVVEKAELPELERAAGGLPYKAPGQSRTRLLQFQHGAADHRRV
jgi:ABC-type multidrug transport system ATPase subunit